MKILFILLISIFLLDILVHFSIKRNFKNKFPKDMLPSLDEGVEIPEIEFSGDINKKIYRTYYDLGKLHLFDKAIKQTENNMSDYEQVFFDDNDIEKFIRENYNERILNAYLSINSDYGPARADFFRYLVVYYYGGIYLDVKSSIIKNIEKDIEENKDKLLVSKGRDNLINYPTNFGLLPYCKNNYNWSDFSGINYGEYNNWHIICPAGHPVMKKVIQQVVTNIEYGLQNKTEYENGEYSVLILTGPIMYTKIIEKYKDNNVKIFHPNLNNTVKYSFGDHKNKGSKKHYSKVKNKQILV